MGTSLSLGIKDMKFLEKIGRGRYSTVKRVSFYTPYKGYKEAAAKIVLSEVGMKEVEIMSKLQHPNIVKLLGFFQQEAGALMIMELAPKWITIRLPIRWIEATSLWIAEEVG